MKTILVVDEPKIIKNADISNHHLEGYSFLELKKIKEAIESFSDIEIYTNLNEFSKNISRFDNCTIFPMYWGKSSRVIKGHVPSICEANNIDYIGPDSYTCILCNDKYISKKYVNQFGFKTSRDFLIYQEDSIQNIKFKLQLLNYPLVIKPNFGGGSTGISNQNLVNNEQEALNIISILLKNHFNPLIIEEYIEGYEVSILLMGGKEKMVINNETKLIVDDKDYFAKSLWAMEDKKINFLSSHYVRSNLITDQDRDKAINLFKSFDKVEYMRIDARINNNGLFVIELSPDCYMGPNCDFSISLIDKGISYNDFIKMVFDNHFSNNKGTPQKHKNSG